MQSNPQGFQGYCKAKATIPVNPGPGNLADVKRKFYDVGHFPGVIGAIDCTRVRIICLNTENAMAFVKRKQFYSINVQAVGDSDAFITNIVARWPGSTYDSRIFENSNIADKLRDGALDGILLDDSGYACRAYLLTPILNPKNAGTILYIGVLGVLLRDALDC